MLGWWNKAREKLLLGQRMCAMPLDVLHRAVDVLESSVMRLTCTDVGNEEEEVDIEVKTIHLSVTFSRHEDWIRDSKLDLFIWHQIKIYPKKVWHNLAPGPDLISSKFSRP